MMPHASFLKNGVRFMAEGGVVPVGGNVPAARRPSVTINPIGQQMIADLQRDFGFSPQVAAGIVGQLAHESGNFDTLQEINPVVEGSRGGWGYAQWTGPRRDEFDAYAKANNLDPSSYAANYGNLVRELKGAEGQRLMKALEGVTDATQAGRVFTDTFLRPGIPGYASRDRYAAAYAGSDPVTAGRWDQGQTQTADAEGAIPDEDTPESRRRDAWAMIAAELGGRAQAAEAPVSSRLAPQQVTGIPMVNVPQ